jgi:hypothetical protein
VEQQGCAAGRFALTKALHAMKRVNWALLCIQPKTLVLCLTKTLDSRVFCRLVSWHRLAGPFLGFLTCSRSFPT